MLAKRLFDIVCSALGLLVLLPLFAVLALWIKLDSPGPVMFRQERVGRHGRLFFIHKFRSMRADAPARGPQITVGMDPRITRSGHCLRATKLDELPQLWDVLRGAMSLVGPRPEVPRYVALYPPEQRERVLSLRPGMTDLASIEYRDESRLLAGSLEPERTYIEVIMPAKLGYACRYARERSFWGDVAIIFKTLRAIMR